MASPCSRIEGHRTQVERTEASGPISGPGRCIDGLGILGIPGADNSDDHSGLLLVVSF
jgi:hypothetical protein